MASPRCPMAHRDMQLKAIRTRPGNRVHPGGAPRHGDEGHGFCSHQCKVYLTDTYDHVEEYQYRHNSEDLVVPLAGCKFLDLLLVLQTEEFQIHQWMFVTDTVDAIYKPDDWQPHSLMDQLAEVVSNLPAPKRSNGKEETRKRSNTTTDGLSNIAASVSRKPMLQNVEKISSIRDLLPFFSQVSIASYESVYANGMIDWESVERGLAWEMFEGR